MSTPQTDQQANSGSALHLWVAIALALVLLVSWLMGYGPGGSKSVPAQTMADRAAATATVLPAPPQASVAAPAAAQASGPASVPAAEPVIAPVAAPTPAPKSALPPAPESAPAPAPAPAPALAPAPGSEASAASVASASGRVVKIYFGSEKASLPQGGARSLAGVAKYLKANPGAKASVSGFHDPSGNLANNQKLAQRRAQAVALALVKLGVNKDRIVLQKPAQTTGTGKPQEARRVEVAVVAS